MSNPVVDQRQIEVGHTFLSKICRALNIDERQHITGVNIDVEADAVVTVTVRRLMNVREGEDIIECVRVMEAG